MSELSVRLVDPRPCYGPGEPVTVDVEWSVPEPPSGAEVVLAWEAGTGTSWEIQEIESYPRAHPTRQYRETLSFNLPLRPWSMNGSLFDVRWFVELRLEGPDRSARCDFFVSPTGAPIRLQSLLPPTDPARSGTLKRKSRLSR